MKPIVLVTYATKMGSTEEVAKAIAEELRAGDIMVEFQPANNVQSLDRYDAVVLGAPLYMGRLHKDACQFLSVHSAGLMKIPVALFVLGPVQKVEKDWTGARQQLEKELTKLPWLSPIIQHVVGGKFDPAKMDFPFKLIPALRKLPASDV